MSRHVVFTPDPDLEKKWKLVDTNTGKEVKVGDERMTLRDIPCRIVQFIPPRRPGSTGHIRVKFATDESVLYYPGVIGARFEEV